MISFAAGQAAFTLVVIILFNIIQPVGWKVGLTRIEDVAIGCGVSIVVGIPLLARGATAALGHALSTAFATSSGYLADAVERLTSTTAARGHRRQRAGVAPRLSAPRRRLPAVLRRTRGEGRVDGDDVPALHGLEPTPVGGLHARLRSRSTLRPQASPRWSPWRSPRRSCVTAYASSTAGTRSSPTSWPTGAPCSTNRRPTPQLLHEVLRKAFEDVRAISGALTGCGPRCRCCGRTNCSRTRARCRRIFMRRPTSSSRGRRRGVLI